MSKRVRCKAVADMTSLSVRKIQEMVANA